MDVAFADNIWKPRRLIAGVNPQYQPHHCYDCISENLGNGSYGIHDLKTLDEWLIWIERFRDEKTGKEMREAIEAAKAPFVEPPEWADFRKRYAETGDAFIQ